MRKTVCLNMIVKDEALVIERCLESVKHLIDFWVIVDTGSTDGTQAVIKECLKQIPGELHERPWVNFAHNRTEALRLADGQSDYLLLIDADEALQLSPEFSLPHLEKDVYFITVRQYEAAEVKRTGLINNHLHWEWRGVLHEFLYSQEAKTTEVVPGALILYNTSKESGRARDPSKYLKDAYLLEQALLDEPNNSRYVYYLGVSYSACDRYEKAIEAFERRSLMASVDAQETFMAIYQIGFLYEKLGKSDAALPYYLRAYVFRPARAEPLFRIAAIYRAKGRSFLGYLLTKLALALPCPKEEVCVEYWVYEYGLLGEHAHCALLTGEYQEALEACRLLLTHHDLPDLVRSQAVRTYALAKAEIDGTRMVAG